MECLTHMTLLILLAACMMNLPECFLTEAFVGYTAYIVNETHFVPTSQTYVVVVIFKDDMGCFDFVNVSSFSHHSLSFCYSFLGQQPPRRLNMWHYSRKMMKPLGIIKLRLQWTA